MFSLAAVVSVPTAVYASKRRPGRPARTGVQGRAGCTEGQDELGDKGVEGGAWQTGSACEKRAKTLGSHLEVPSGDPKAPQKLQVEPKSGPVGPQSSQEAPS